MSSDSKCHCFAVTMGRTAAKAGRIWAGQIAHSCNAATMAATSESPPLHAHAPKRPVACKQPHLGSQHTHTHARTLTHRSMIDGKRHKGQQSAGLHLDRTRLLLHHLGLGDRADPHWSPLHTRWNIQHRSAIVAQGSGFKELPVSPALYLTCILWFTVTPWPVPAPRPPACEGGLPCGCEWHTHLSRSRLQISTPVMAAVYLAEELTLGGNWYTEHIIQTWIPHSHILLLRLMHRNRACSRADLRLSTS